MNDKEKLARWMINHGYATGHGDTIEDLLDELDWQIAESWGRVIIASVEAEREACKKIAIEMANTQANMNQTWRNACMDVANEIEARGRA